MCSIQSANRPRIPAGFRPRSAGVLPILLALACLASPRTASSQHPSPDTLSTPAPVPFGPGEEVRYKVKVGIFSIGEAVMRIPRIDTIRGVHRPTPSSGPSTAASPAFASGTGSSAGSTPARSRLCASGRRPTTVRRAANSISSPEERRWQRTDIDSAGVLPTALPLDDVSFVYFARTLELQPGIDAPLRPLLRGRRPTPSSSTS